MKGNIVSTILVLSRMAFLTLPSNQNKPFSLNFKPLDEQCILMKLPVCYNLKINFVSLVYLTND